MVKSLNSIKTPIDEEIKEFHHRFKSAMKSDVPLLDKVTNFIIKRKGKQMRPMFIFLSAKICGEVNELTYHAANLVELLHTEKFLPKHSEQLVEKSVQFIQQNIV